MDRADPGRRWRPAPGLELATTIDRRDFGFEWQMALPNGNDALAYEVALEVSLALFQPED